MSRIVIDAAMLSKLANIKETVELCDESGRAIGRFTPTFRSPPSALEPQISEEELRRREREGGGRKLAEIMADLEKRA